jgi:N-methylhydantoinase A/oxoprolinase/acetone carboxylase beta subunit
MTWVIGVDVGGTFTDLYAFEEHSGISFAHKTPSIPENPAQAIIHGLHARGAAHSLDLATIARLAHGTTVATNTLIQRQRLRATRKTPQCPDPGRPTQRQVHPPILQAILRCRSCER